VFGLSWFENAFRDLVDFDFAAGYINIGRARTEGLEASVRTRFGAAQLGASYSRLSARDTVAGTELLRRPRDKFSVDVSTPLAGRFDLTVTGLWVGHRLDRDFSAYPYQTVGLPGYVLIGAVLSAAVNSRLEVFACLDNALDVRYEQVWGYGAPGFCLRTGFRFTR
jgi:vitamin B12 transporter